MSKVQLTNLLGHCLQRVHVSKPSIFPLLQKIKKALADAISNLELLVQASWSTKGIVYPSIVQVPMVQSISGLNYFKKGMPKIPLTL